MLSNLMIDWPSSDPAALQYLSGLLCSQGLEAERFLELANHFELGGSIASYFAALSFAKIEDHDRFVKEILRCSIMLKPFKTFVSRQTDATKDSELVESSEERLFFTRGPWFYHEGKYFESRFKFTQNLPIKYSLESQSSCFWC